MKMTKLFRLDVILGILMLIAALGALMLAWNNPSDQKLQNSPDAKAYYKNLVDENDIIGTNIVTTFTLQKNIITATKFSISADDCLKQVKVNDLVYDFQSKIGPFDSKAGYCNPNAKIPLELKDYLKNGNNKIEIVTSNSNNPGGITWRTSILNPTILGLLVVIGFVGSYLAYRIGGLIGIDSINSTFLLAFLILGIGVRIGLLNYKSGDYGSFLAPWYDFVVNNGYWAAQAQRFADYTPPYLYLLTIVTLLPINKIVGIKLISLMFEILLGFIVFLVVKQKNGKSRNLAIVAAAASLMLPTVILNGAMWGQCDVIYSSFMVLSLYFLTKDKGFWAFWAFGLGFAFKFQAIFLAPLLLIWLLFHPKKWYYIFVPPINYFLACVPAALLGRPWLQLIRIYLDQSNSYPSLSSGMANLWKFIPEAHNEIFKLPGILLGGMAFLAIPVLIYNLKPKFTPNLWVKLALICTLLVPFVLPKMHERYFFPAEVFSLIYAFYNPKLFWVALGVNLIGFFEYLPFLLGNSMEGYWFYIVLAMTGIIVFLIYELIISCLNLKQLSRFEAAKNMARLPGG